MSKFGRHILSGMNAANGIMPRLLASTLFLSLFVLSSAGIASAQSQADIEANKLILPPTDGLTVNVTPSNQSLNFDQADFVGLSSSLKGAMLDIPTQTVGSRLFNLDVTDIGCRAGEEGCFRRDDTLDLGYKKSITANIDSKIDIQLTPRASVSFNDESSSAVVGALVRIGDDLREGSDLKANTWYMFAGADAEAVTYSPNSVRRITSGQFHLQDRIIVGDAQAGVGYRIGDADVSLGYFRREVTSFGREVNSNTISFKEDAAALSFTWRR
ncbi:MAG: hypothetical protein ACSHXY_04325 [Alphaproteobacteria bacterium]